jgi:putative heme iron utilization protein
LSSPAKAQPLEVLDRLLEEYKTGSLATVSEQGLPQVSYVPLALDRARRRFLFFVSDLAEHTANLRHSGRASLMLVEDESRSEQLFARHRLTFNGPVVVLERGSPEWETAAEIYGQRFGKLFGMLKGLNDFHMFGFHPEEIRLVVGFGQAYRVEGEDWRTLTLLTGR